MRTSGQVSEKNSSGLSKRPWKQFAVIHSFMHLWTKITGEHW